MSSQHRMLQNSRAIFEPGQVRPSGFMAPFPSCTPRLHAHDPMAASFSNTSRCQADAGASCNSPCSPPPDLVTPPASLPTSPQGTGKGEANRAGIEPSPLRPILPPEPPLWTDAGLARLHTFQRTSADEAGHREHRHTGEVPRPSAAIRQRRRRQRRHAATMPLPKPWQQADTLERPSVQTGRHHQGLAAALGMGIGMGMVIGLLGTLIILAAIAGPVGQSRYPRASGNTTPAGVIATVIYTALMQLPGLGAPSTPPAPPTHSLPHTVPRTVQHRHSL
jgi:hypothetical protein